MSNYPHSTLATSLSTSPYALHNNLEALIQRSRTNPHAGQAPDEDERAPRRRRSSAATRLSTGWASRRSSRGDHLEPGTSGFGRAGIAQLAMTEAAAEAGDSQAQPDESGVLMFSHDEENGPSEQESDVTDTEPVEHDDRRGSRSHRRGGKYGAIGVSEPLAAAGGPVAVPTMGPAGNSRSRSKGRTPPRAVVRPMTQGRRDAALAAGASLTALPPVSSSVMSASTDEESHSPSTTVVPTSPHASMFGSMRRGRNVDRRAISPVVGLRPLPPGTSDYEDYTGDEDDDEVVSVAKRMARRASFAPGASMISAYLSCDPAEELDAQDLSLPVDEHGNEVHSAYGALGSELPLIVRSTIPVFLAQLAEYSLALTGVISIGHLGTLELAASSLANMTASVTCFSILQGLATALDTLLPAAWTSSDPSRVGLWTQRMFVVLFVSVIPMFALWMNIEPILIFLHQTPRVASLAAQYLRYLSFGIPGYAFNIILKKYLQAQNIMHIPTYVLFIVAPTNVLLNWLLVWGPDSIRLGFIGGAVATSISFNLTGFMLFIYVMYIGPRDAWHPFTLHDTLSKLGTVTSLGLAGTIMLSSEWWAWEVCALAASQLGPTTLAAQSVLLSSCSALYQFPAALGVSSSVRVGNLLGAGRAWEAKWASRASFILAFCFALFNSTICIGFRHSWGYMFNSDHEVVAIVATVMPWIGLFQIADGIAGAANAILRALALHASGAVINMVAYYVIGLPLGLWLTFSPSTPFGLVGIWMGLTAALVFASSVGVYIVWGADWGRGVERVRERLGLPPIPADVKFADEPEPQPRTEERHVDPERQPLL